MFWVKNRYAKIWKIFDAKEKYVDLSVSTSEKTPDNTYVNSRWPARAIGKAFNQVKKGDITEGEQYAILKAKLSNEQYKDDSGEWKSALRLLILEFAPAGSDDADGGEDLPEPPASKAAPPRKDAAKKTSTKKAEPKDESDPWG